MTLPLSLETGLLARLRVHYPTGGLLTELVQIHQDQHIVRALVQVDGVTIATALAAAPMVELAEERARSRVLALVGIDTGPAREGLLEEARSPAPLPPLPVSHYGGSLADASPALPSLSTPSKGLPEIRKITPKLTPAAPATIGLQTGAERPTVTPDIGPEATRSDGPIESGSPAGSLADPTNLPPPSLDLSDEIEHTSLEMKRLGWTEQQGREYLMATYNKKSRHHLSPSELLDFLSYLKSQP